MSTFTQPTDSVIIRGFKNLAEVPLSDIIKEPERSDFRFMHEMATLCANVYQETDQFDLDWDAKDKRFRVEGWEELPLKKLDPTPPRGKYKVKGLKYEVWKKQTADSGTMVALIFRGTAVPIDWYVNLRWITRFIPFTWDHYAQTKFIIHDIISEIHEKVGVDNIEIVSTGHSLGGGLAHLAAYSTPHIKKVFAFDSSPVTGFYSLKKKEREANKVGIKVYRIFEFGELLSFIRSPMKLLYPLSYTDPHIIEARYDFVHNDPISQHSIKKLAYNLTNAIKRAVVEEKK